MNKTKKKKAASKKASKKAASGKAANNRTSSKKKSASTKKTASKKKSASTKKTASKKKSASKNTPVKKNQNKSPAQRKPSTKKGPAAGAASPSGGAKSGKAGKKGTTKGPVVRKPAHAEELKDKLGKLAQARTRIRSLKRSLEKSFFDIGEILASLEDESLHEVKGYGSFEAFLEREVDIGAQQALRLVRIVRSLQREAATRAGLERSEAALAALEGEDEESSRVPFGSPIPPHKR